MMVWNSLRQGKVVMIRAKLRAVPQFVVLVSLLGTLLMPATPLAAQAPANDPLRADQTGDGVHLHWSDGGQAGTALAALPLVRYQGYDLPLALITVQTTESVKLEQTQFATLPWSEPLAPAAPMAPPVLADDVPLFPGAETVALPAAPLFILREGMVGGQRLTVIALSPLFVSNGQTLLATTLAATVPNATLVDTAALDNVTAAAHTQLDPATVAPTNPLAARAGWKVIVHQAGLQRLTGQALADAGLNLATTDPTALQLWRQGAQTPLEVTGLTAGRLTATSEVRFYTHVVGDRWQTSETYWLTLAPNGLRLNQRSVAPATAPLRTTVVEAGRWRDYNAYDSYQAGADGDHWFQAELRRTNGGALPTATIGFLNQLPPVVGSSLTFSLTLSSRFPATYTFAVQLDDEVKNLQWLAQPVNGNSENWRAVITTTAGVANARLTLSQSESSYSGASVWFDQAQWEQPAQLQFNNNGAIFTGLSGRWRYQWQGAPQVAGQYRFYDITDPASPVLLTGATAAGFEDGPTARTYLLAGAAMIATPEVQAHTPANFTATTGAQALYIAPQEFLTALEPLLEQRRSQGYTALAVDVQTIYDAWSYGQISAEAIRTFLRFARQQWQQPPIAVTLVGDATWDPHNYEQKEYSTNFVPPYVAYVDPWLGEAACENCYVQLDGDDPLTGDQVAGGPSAFFSPDLWIGRLPVKSSFELTTVVAKLIRYENATTPSPWRNSTLFLADNYVRSLDEKGSPLRDPAGDFARMNDLVIRRTLCTLVNHPVICRLDGLNNDLEVISTTLHSQIETLLPQAPLQVSRYYYDPFPAISDPAGAQGWRIADARQARQSTLAAMSQGAGVVVYSGHANHWQWGALDTWPNQQGGDPKPGLVGLNDPDTLANRDRLFINLSMTCLTSQFHKPANSGTTLDERLFLANNGAVAVWGSSGLSVVHGHDALQRGFFTKLWTSPAMDTPLGALLAAGYNELLTKSVCCQDAAHTFLLLGDPLTPARVLPLDLLHLPLVQLQ
jgi:hypothetical protein